MTDPIYASTFSAAEATLVDDVAEPTEAQTLVKPFTLPEPKEDESRHLFDGIREKGKVLDVVNHIDGLKDATQQDHVLDNLTSTLRPDQLRTLLDTAREAGKADLFKSIEDRMVLNATPLTQQQVIGLGAMNSFKQLTAPVAQKQYAEMSRHQQEAVAQSLQSLGQNQLDEGLKYAKQVLTPAQFKTLDKDAHDYAPGGSKSAWQAVKVVPTEATAVAPVAATKSPFNLQLQTEFWKGAGGNMLAINPQATYQMTPTTKIGLVGTYQLRMTTSETLDGKSVNAGTPGAKPAANAEQWQAGLMVEQKIPMGPLTGTLEAQLRHTHNEGNAPTATYDQMDARAGARLSLELMGDEGKPGNVGLHAWIKMQDLYANQRPVATPSPDDDPGATVNARDNILYVYGGGGVHGTFDLFGAKTTASLDYNYLRRSSNDSVNGGPDLDKDKVRGDVNLVHYLTGKVEVTLSPKFSVGGILNYTLAHKYDPGAAVNLTSFEQNGTTKDGFIGSGFKGIGYLKLTPFAEDPPKPADPKPAAPTESTDKKAVATAAGRTFW